MISIPGETRTRFCARHALISPDGHVASTLPGVSGVRVVVHISPAMGAKFVQSTLTFEPNGCADFSAGSSEYFFYVQEGSIGATVEGKDYTLDDGSYLFVPAQKACTIKAAATAKLICFEKTYAMLPTSKTPPVVIAHAAKVQGQPFLGNPKALLQVLLPDEIGFDMAVNIFTYQPGAALPFVETHVMEHGLLMLDGEGIYRLENAWYPVSAGDVIWMAPYCPQWFAAIGDKPASYLYYKDVNRPLLAP
jgi:(S)-ureidoglycine aminohydrolase